MIPAAWLKKLAENKALVIAAGLLLATVGAWLARENTFRHQVDTLTTEVKNTKESLAVATTRVQQLQTTASLAVHRTRTSKDVLLAPGVVGKEVTEREDSQADTQTTLLDQYAQNLHDEIEQVDTLKTQVHDLTLKTSRAARPAFGLAYGMTAESWAMLAPRHWAGAALNFELGPLMATGMAMVGLPPAGVEFSMSKAAVGLFVNVSFRGIGN